MEASITVEEMDVQPDTFAEEIESKTDEAGNEHESDTDEAGQQPSDWECEGPLFDLHHTDTGGKYTAAFDIVDDGKVVASYCVYQHTSISLRTSPSTSKMDGVSRSIGTRHSIAAGMMRI